DISRSSKGQQEKPLTTNPLPVQQYQRQNTPDGDVIQTGVTQNPLTYGLAQDFQFFHKQHQNGQGSDRAGHAYTQHKLPGQPLGTQPAIKGQHPQPHQTAHHQRHPQCQTGGDTCLRPVFPGLAQIQLHPGDKHEKHHRPPGNTIQCQHHLGPENELVVLGKDGARNAPPQQNASDNLHHYQRGPVVGTSQTPDQIGKGENDD